MIFHLRVKQPTPKGRPGYSAAHFARVTGNYGPEPRAVCGGELTTYDTANARDLVAWGHQEHGAMIPCPDCRAAS